MSVDQYGELGPWDMTARTGQLEEWLATTIRGVFWSWVGDAEPSPTTWARIRGRILRLQQRTRQGLAPQSIQAVVSNSAAGTSGPNIVSLSNKVDKEDPTSSVDTSRSEVCATKHRRG